MNRAATFLDAFTPPDGTVGQAAVLVAMSATEGFLDAAMERFTRLRARQRMALGAVQAWLMLDPHSSAERTTVLSPGRVPGLLELHPRPVHKDSLLHAKLALLSFGTARTGEASVLRLVVSTGNFTEASARQQLELVWLVDVPLDGSAEADDRADVAAGARFTAKLLKKRYHQDRATTQRLDTLLHLAVEGADSDSPVPRFIHSWDEALLPQIKKRFEEGRKVNFNFLLCGSGFYEQASKKGGKPEVVADLEGFVPTTRSTRRVLLVEPSQAGAVASWAQRGDDAWEVVQPTSGNGRRRLLHAKFIFAGRRHGEAVGHGSLYLGSGNLSHRGLRTHGGRAHSNLECGVVLPVSARMNDHDFASRLFWYDDQEAIPAEAWRDLGEEGEVLFAELIKASPILSATIEESVPKMLGLHWREDVAADLRVEVAWLGAPAREVSPGVRAIDLSEGSIPSVLDVRELDGGGRWSVPVVDPNGRVGWEPSRYDFWEDALEALFDFPLRPAESASDDDGDEGEGGNLLDARSEGEGTPPHRYALHAAAEFIEQFAAFQATFEGDFIDEWLDHLDRVLVGQFPSAMLDAWRSMRINVFEALREPSLAPGAMSPSQRNRYEQTLGDAARRWGLS